MTREIKFRAYIDGEMILLPLAGLGYFDFEGSYALSFAVDGYSEFWAHEHYESATKKHCSNAPIMQYTGLKDKNGVEIYEGDILNDGRGEYGVVEYRQPQFVVWSNNVHFQLAEGKINIMQLEYTEVIGNVHENQYLLNNANPA